ncbi:MAG: D-glycero-alpha-D-manno-heptose-1,7-bisphosphate 7-phosphatase [Holosporales bacterium]|jgi:D-glycero-D-manno-heptose 1,7-bisphosphate phosphatase
MTRLVLLDRDGVINVDLGRAVLHPDELQLIPGVAAAIAALNNAGVKVAVCTNQACVGRGEITDAELDTIHAALIQKLAANGAHLDALYAATDKGESARKKPAPGMLFEALEKFAASAAETPFVGDALRDLEAAWAAGCKAVLVGTGKGRETEVLLQQLPTRPLIKVVDLPEFVTQYLSHVVAR